MFENLGDWWKNVGSKRLNEIIINFIGYNVGYVPLTNLTDDFCSLTAKNQEDLIPYMLADGCTLRVNDAPGGKKVYIFVK